MSVLIKDMEIPKNCNECKLDLRTDICKAFCEWNAEHPYSIRATDRLPDCPLSEAPEPCEDTVSRQAAIDAVYKCTDIFVNNLPVMVDKADACKALAELPPAHPDIVRCKDCKDFRRYYIGIDFKFCDRTETEVCENDFCSRGKEKGR